MKLVIKLLTVTTLLVFSGSLLATGSSGSGNVGRKDNQPVCVADATIGSGGSTLVTVSTSTNDCGLMAGPEAVVSVTIPFRGSWIFDLAPSGTSAGDEFYYSLRDECCGGNEIYRKFVIHNLLPQAFEVGPLDAGTYYLVIELASPTFPEVTAAINVALYEGTDACAGIAAQPGLTDNGDGTFTYRQVVDSSTHADYAGPFVNAHGCVGSTPALYGFDYLSWYDDDFSYTFHLPTFINPQIACIQSVSMKVCGWDVDFSDCPYDPYRTDACERDVILAEGLPLQPYFLEGTNMDWSTTTFQVPEATLADGIVHMRIDFDAGRQDCDYAGMIHQAVLDVVFTPGPCNSRPFAPTGYANGCITADSTMCVHITGPAPADPDLDNLTYSFEWSYASYATGYAFVPARDVNDSCLSAAASAIGDRWQVAVYAHDPEGQVSDPWITQFTVDATCTENNPTSWDYGDLDTASYHLTYTQDNGGPANRIRQYNIAWLGLDISDDHDPKLVDADEYDDGVLFVNSPWEPCTEVCVDVRVSAGAGYHDQSLYLYAWKDGNLDGDFLDTLCLGESPECLINGALIEGLHPLHDSTYRFCFPDPGVRNIGTYNGILRFRLLSEPVGNVAGLTFVDTLLGETEDYVISDLQLAVQLQNFTATSNAAGVTLAWATASEQNSSHFLVERLAGGSWRRLDAQVPAAGNSNTTRNYTLRDENVSPGQEYSYRLIAVDMSGIRVELGTAEVTYAPAQDVVQDYRLGAAYPNPFNPSATITFDIKEAGNVTLKVFDVTGREVATLVDGFRAAGRYSTVFNASGLPSGLYLYRMTTPGFSAIQKMILLK